MVQNDAKEKRIDVRPGSLLYEPHAIQHKQSTPTGLSQRGNRDDLGEKEQ